ncbi:hypothetical protein [Mycolicibacterium sp. CBMA 226]|uniref:hypothetical protein n=1 Tax=Mycolicibacterium sp. CBMA 226 TaxID=2606611 RepID=UPI0012DD772F|nr:hypothetical protein [Mycolicibacterium sp. CBMA 226]MUL76848.1 hypothetical protein [Mycolicibacterium sp. CBMA 226]
MPKNRWGRRIALLAVVGAAVTGCDSINVGSLDVFGSASPAVKGPPIPPEMVRHDVQQLVWQFPQLRKPDEAVWVTWNNSGDPSLAGKVDWIDAVIKLSPSETARLLAEYRPIATDRQPLVQKILQPELPDGPYLAGPELNKLFSSPIMSTQAFLDRDHNVLVLTATSGGRGLS